MRQVNNRVIQQPISASFTLFNFQPGSHSTGRLAPIVFDQGRTFDGVFFGYRQFLFWDRFGMSGQLSRRDFFTHPQFFRNSGIELLGIGKAVDWYGSMRTETKIGVLRRDHNPLWTSASLRYDPLPIPVCG